MDETAVKTENPLVEEMFKIGAQYGYSKSRRHPSARDFIFGVKNRVEIWNLEKTAEFLKKACDFAETLGKEKKQLLFVGGKKEAAGTVLDFAKGIGMPYVAGRWIGGALTNHSEIKKRIARLENLIEQREKGELAKYTKKERLLIDREIEDLEKKFRGLVPLGGLPSGVFIVDPKKEHIALSEAEKTKIPVIALMNTDCDLKSVQFPIPANDAAAASIRFFTGKIAAAYEKGRDSAE